MTEQYPVGTAFGYKKLEIVLLVYSSCSQNLKKYKKRRISISKEDRKHLDIIETVPEDHKIAVFKLAVFSAS